MLPGRAEQHSQLFARQYVRSSSPSPIITNKFSCFPSVFKLKRSCGNRKQTEVTWGFHHLQLTAASQHPHCCWELELLAVSTALSSSLLETSTAAGAAQLAAAHRLSSGKTKASAFIYGYIYSCTGRAPLTHTPSGH